MQWKIINEVLNHKRDMCVVMSTGNLIKLLKSQLLIIMLMPVRDQQSQVCKVHFSVLNCGGFFLWSVFFIFFFCPFICILLFSTVNIVCDRYQDNSVWGGDSLLGRRDCQPWEQFSVDF